MSVNGYYKFRDRGNIKRELRNQYAIVTIVDSKYFDIKIMTGVWKDTVFPECILENLDRDFELVAKNKGRNVI